MSDFPYIILIVTVIAINGMAVDYEIENDSIHRDLIVGELSCNNILIDVFKQSMDVTDELKKCEKRRKRR